MFIVYKFNLLYLCDTKRHSYATGTVVNVFIHTKKYSKTRVTNMY